MIDDGAALTLLLKFARTLVRQYDLDEVLTGLAGDLREVLDVAGAGVMLTDENDDLRFVSSSDAVLKRLEDLQIELDEGPCLHAYRTGHPVLAADLREDPQFPNFGPRAVEAKMLAVFSYPLQYEQQVFGALNLYRHEPGSLDERQQELGGAFADIATLYLMHGSDDERREEVNRQLQGALDSRIVIEQAKGFVVSACDVAPTEAFERLRRHARSNGRKLREVAADVVARRIAVDVLEPTPATQ